MADDKTFAVGEVLSAADTNEYLVRGYWKRIGRQIITSGSPVTTVTFSSIESRFRSFRLHINVNGEVAVRLNNDSGTNYTYLLYDMDDTAMNTGTTGSYINLSRGSVQVQEMTIAKLTSSSQALIMGGSISQFSTSGIIGRQGGYTWRNTSALINRIDVFVFSGTFYGVVALEGMVGV